MFPSRKNLESMWNVRVIGLGRMGGLHVGAFVSLFDDGSRQASFRLVRF